MTGLRDAWGTEPELFFFSPDASARPVPRRRQVFLPLLCRVVQLPFDADLVKMTHPPPPPLECSNRFA